ncbi:hypothetical protein M427DRAFT_39082 [Gonapodya prolifera JEL478]|uniref:RNI-like protein n=1 Tax=Gonapodya prolifera (strain JEL478) TaxID=1344416 RepID=A0A138ZY03_GONPJ|nr:hypothetical protein M427DRAFT_39082 [Gonapodya prolifera JEL478]|eukprot:KXS09378.1 hypothetical protein M427DRAFT_39082 [Gonapodya prolifera JEL478]
MVLRPYSALNPESRALVRPRTLEIWPGLFPSRFLPQALRLVEHVGAKVTSLKFTRSIRGWLPVISTSFGSGALRKLVLHFMQESVDDQYQGAINGTSTDLLISNNANLTTLALYGITDPFALPNLPVLKDSLRNLTIRTWKPVVLYTDIYQSIAKFTKLATVSIFEDLDSPDRNVKLDCLRQIANNLVELEFDGFGLQFNLGVLPIFGHSVELKLKVLYLNRAGCSDKGFVDHLARTCPHLVDLTLRECSIDNIATVVYLLQKLGRTLKSLNVEGNRMEQSVDSDEVAIKELHSLLVEFGPIDLIADIKVMRRFNLAEVDCPTCRLYTIVEDDADRSMELCIFCGCNLAQE